MALRRETIRKGFVCEYHKILTIRAEYNASNMDRDNYETLHVTVAVYKDASVRLANVDDFIVINTYHFYVGDVGAPRKAELGDVYDALKDLPAYSGAVNV